MPRKPSLGQQLRYRFDNFMAKGGFSIFLSLLLVFAASFAVVVAARALVLLLDPGGAEHDGFWANVYVVFLQLTDPGNMGLELPSSAFYKMSAILAGAFGVIILSMLIAFITTALDQKLQELKKGHSKVIEDDHTLILGWSDRVTEILRELVLANESEDDPCVVILSEQDKEVMDDYLDVHLTERKNTRIVTRSGSVSSVVNLDIVSVTSSKSVIVLSDCTDAATADEKATSDTRVIKTILGLMASKAPGQSLNVVAEIFDERNRELAKDISPHEVTTVHALDILAKILVQTSRSIGLSVVYGEIMSFDGCELYFFHDDWGTVGFDELVYHFPDGVPLGIRHGDGRLTLNPPPGTRMSSDDDILILAQDDSTIEYRKVVLARPRDIPLSGLRLERHVEHELILGWSAKAPIIIEQYADYVEEGSTITVMLREPSEDLRLEILELRERISGLEIRLVDQDPMHLETLLEATPFLYDNIIVLSQSGEATSPEAIDSQTIIILLLLRKVAKMAGHDAERTKLITEVLDSENQDLIARAGVNDFIISNRLVSMLLAQVSEEADIYDVYDDLFQEGGSEIYVKPARLYFQTFPVEVTFADLIGIARRRQEVCLGIKIKADEKNPEANYGVKLIPEKTARYRFEAEDCLVVLAEDET